MLALIDVEWRDVVDYEGLYEISIVSLLKEGILYQKDIGVMYNIATGTVGKIKRGEKWSWLTGIGV
mgnify:CR=1 FL=1